MIFKVTIIFELRTGTPSTRSRLGGWTESHYIQVDDATEAARRVQVGTGLFGSILDARAALLPASSQIVGFKLQDVGPPVGRMYAIELIRPGKVGNPTDVPQMSVYLRVPTLGRVNVGKQELRGIPDGQVTFGAFTPDDAYKGSMTAYIRTLGAYQIRCVDFTQPSFLVKTISALGVATATVNPLGFVVGDNVRVLRAQTASGRVGTETFITAIGGLGREFTLNYWPFGAATGGRIRKQAIVYAPIDFASTQPQRVSLRKVGRPFLEYRGRVSARRS